MTDGSVTASIMDMDLAYHDKAQAMRAKKSYVMRVPRLPAGSADAGCNGVIVRSLQSKSYAFTLA
jgi:hypothetical protein